jgi:protein-arginine kinase activator protein McsA
MAKMTERELNYLADKIVDKIVDKFFKSGEFEIEEVNNINQEQILLGEIARLMTLLSSYEEKEEYEKAAIIKRKIEILENHIRKL